LKSQKNGVEKLELPSNLKFVENEINENPNIIIADYNNQKTKLS